MKHILVVDDNSINLNLAKVTLNETYKVTLVNSGSQALNFLTGHTCDLILLDINMPEMDGFEVLKELKQREITIPVVFLTGETDPASESRCIQEGAYDIIAKPFVKDVMLNRIGHIFELEEYRRS